MLLFKDIHGNRIDPVNHTLEVIKNYPYAEIHIGTDSQNINKESRYTTVIAYRLGSRGVHYILSKKTVFPFFMKNFYVCLCNEYTLNPNIF